MNLLIFLLPVLIGLTLCLLISTRLGNAWVLVWMAPGIGMGLTSILFFLWSLLFHPRFQPRLYLGLEFLLLAALAYILWRRRASLDLKIPSFRVGVGEALLGLVLAAALVFFVFWFLRQTAENPLGSWDAWTLWNSRARYLLLGDQQSWRNVFTVDINHPDYPYLLTGFIARGWVLIGKDRTFVPVVTAGLFTVSTVGLLGALVTRLRGLGAGLLASLLLVTLPVFAWTCTSEYADLPLAFYFLGTLMFLYFYFTEGRHPFALICAGAMAGLALWTKNEGASFVLAVAAACIGQQLMQRDGLRRVIRQNSLLIAGLLPALLLYLGYRAWLVPPTDLFESRPTAVLLQQVTDWTRYWTIIKNQWQMFLGWGNWKVPYLPCMAAYMIIAGMRPLCKNEKTGARVLAAILALTFLQYLAIFLITPHDLAWHLSTSIGRLYNQLLPGSLLVIFLFTRSAFEEKTA